MPNRKQNFLKDCTITNELITLWLIPSSVFQYKMVMIQRSKYALDLRVK